MQDHRAAARGPRAERGDRSLGEGQQGLGEGAANPVQGPSTPPITIWRSAVSSGVRGRKLIFMCHQAWKWSILTKVFQITL